MENLDSLKIASNLLKSEREKSSLTVEEVSFELKLDKKIIEDIESGNFNNFNSYLFLKGYVRNYANFLGVRVSLPEIKNKNFNIIFNIILHIININYLCGKR